MNMFTFARMLVLCVFFWSATISLSAQTNVYFQKPATWGTPINIHYWGATGATPISDSSFPGVEMTLVSGDIYLFRFPAGTDASNMLFNDGTNQTNDLIGVDLTSGDLLFDGVANATNPPQSSITDPLANGFPTPPDGFIWAYAGTGTYCSVQDDVAPAPFDSSPYIEGAGARTYGSGAVAVPGPDLGCNDPNDTSFGLNLQCPDAANMAIRVNDGSGWLRSDVSQGCPFIQAQVFGNAGDSFGNAEGLAYAQYGGDCNGTKAPNDNFPSSTTQVRRVQLREWTNAAKPADALTNGFGNLAIESTVSLLDDGVGNGTGIGGDEAKVLIIGGDSGPQSTFDISYTQTLDITIDNGFAITDQNIGTYTANNNSYTQNDAGPGGNYNAADWTTEGGQGFTNTFSITSGIREDGEILTVQFSSMATISAMRTSGNADARFSIGPGLGGKAQLCTTYNRYDLLDVCIPDNGTLQLAVD